MTITAPTEATASCTLDIAGMTCASCVGRVEKALRRVDGVTAAEVNLATEVATVRFDPAQAGLEELAAAVTQAGYTATPRHDVRPATRQATADANAAASEERDSEAYLTSLKRKWQITLAAGLGLMVPMYVPLYLDPRRGGHGAQRGLTVAIRLVAGGARG